MEMSGEILGYFFATSMINRETFNSKHAMIHAFAVMVISSLIRVRVYISGFE
jgi:hypothetical protein